MAKIAKFKISRTQKNGTFYYQLNCPAYLSADKKPKQMFFKLRADAERKRAELIAASKENDYSAVLTNSQLIDARRALERLAEARLNMTLDKAIELALPTLKASGAHISVSALLEEYYNLKEPEWRPKTIRSYNYASRKFAESFGELPISEVTPGMIREWLVAFNAPTHAAALSRTISPAFSYAVRQGMLPFSPFTRMEKIKTPKKHGIDIFTPAEARALLDAASEDSKAAFAILLFAGVRPVELTRLKWSNIKADFIHITPDVAKTEQVRNVEIEPNLAAWLDAYRPFNADSTIIPRNWKRKNQEARRASGLSGRQDTARHSYATYYLAKYKNKIALEANLGHTAGSAMLMRHYRAAATPADAEAYWNIYPNPLG